MAAQGHRDARQAQQYEADPLATDRRLLDEVGKAEVRDDDVLHEGLERRATSDHGQPHQQDDQGHGATRRQTG